MGFVDNGFYRLQFAQLLMQQVVGGIRSLSRES